MILKQQADSDYEMCIRVCSMLKKKKINLYSIVNCNIHNRCYIELLHSE